MRSRMIFFFLAEQQSTNRVGSVSQKVENEEEKEEGKEEEITLRELHLIVPAHTRTSHSIRQHALTGVAFPPRLSPP